MKRIQFCLIILFITIFSLAAAEETVVESAMVSEQVEDNIGIITLTNADAQAENYILRMMPHSIRLRAIRLSGMSLASPSKELYLSLQTLIASVAAGETASTIFEIPYGDVFQSEFTAEELGIERILDEERKITDEAKTAAMAAMIQNRNQINGRSTIQCLMNDYPYELYWYDKTENAGTKITYRTTTYSATSSRIAVNGTITVKMMVSADYAALTIISDGTARKAEYEVDTGYGESVRIAAKNAEQILNQAEEMDDYEKLCYFRDVICDLTDYNHEAINEKTYGDPWQLVWVFDGKPNTRVVCEGYAKAFQYLTGMATDEATAISVQGSTPAGAHMWNIVAIGGHNYLVDLTNQDNGYDLFLKGFVDGNLTMGYTIDGGKGVIQYKYSDDLQWNEADVTLSPFDYSEWSAAVKRAPEVEISHDMIYPGFSAVVRVVHEDGLFPATAVIVHGAEEDYAVEGKDVCMIGEAGEYTVSVIRDGVQSNASSTIKIIAEEMPEGKRVRVPDGSTIEEEAFAGNPGIDIMEAHNCIIQRDAFRDCEHLALAILSNCIVESGAFEEETLLCLDRIDEWPQNPFIVLDTAE